MGLSGAVGWGRGAEHYSPGDAGPGGTRGDSQRGQWGAETVREGTQRGRCVGTGVGEQSVWTGGGELPGVAVTQSWGAGGGRHVAGSRKREMKPFFREALGGEQGTTEARLGTWGQGVFWEVLKWEESWLCLQV